MIKKLGKLSIDSNRIISYFESTILTNNSTYVDPLYVTKQKTKFVEKGYTQQQINNWEGYHKESTSMQYLSGNDLIKNYILHRLDPELLEEQQLDQHIIGWNIQKQMPGHFTVPHYDIYHSITNYSKDIDYKINQVGRFWIPLQDSKFGHVLFVGNAVLSDFKEGEIYDWDVDDLHAAANVGFEPRYTLLLYLSKKSI
jgi:hypothetical protein